MRVKKNILLIILFPYLMVPPATAQSALTISAGSSIFVSSGTFLSLDSLTLIPSASFTINGANTATMDAILTHPAENNHIQRVFHFLNTIPSFSGDITIYYQDDELNSIPESQLTLNVNDGTLWNAYPLNTTRDASNNFITVTGLTNISMNELTLANISAPLPITFISINADCLNNGENISWSTSQEFNSKFFIIERSMDGSIWQNIGSVPAAGNSSDVRNYTFSDDASYGLAFYRVAEFDLDGRQNISAIAISSCSIAESFAIHPNPVLDIIFIRIKAIATAPVSLRLYDAGGSLIRKIQTNLSKGANELQLDLSGLSEGIYMLYAQWGNNMKISKLIKK